jgi:hypothetical protein
MSTDLPNFTSAARMTASLVLPLLVGLDIIRGLQRKWRSGSASPCTQSNGRVSGSERVAMLADPVSFRILIDV